MKSECAEPLSGYLLLMSQYHPQNSDPLDGSSYHYHTLKTPLKRRKEILFCIA